MLFDAHCFWYPKDLEYAHAYEDSFCVDDEKGVVAISDGVASAMFSRQWADLMTAGIVDGAPGVDDRDAFHRWLNDRRAEWTAAIDVSKLNYFQRKKLEEAGGGFATVLWAELAPLAVDAGDDGNDAVEYSLRATAVGDCCLFLVRENRVLHKFPLEDSSGFNLDPISICSVDQNHDHVIEFETLHEKCQTGDLLVLATDAISKHFYQQLDLDETIDWEDLWRMSSDEWCRRVCALRDLPGEQHMRVDDTTLVMLRLADRESLTIGPDRPDSMRPQIVSPFDGAAADATDRPSDSDGHIGADPQSGEPIGEELAVGCRDSAGDEFNIRPAEQDRSNDAAGGEPIGALAPSAAPSPLQ